MQNSHLQKCKQRGHTHLCYFSGTTSTLASVDCLSLIFFKYSTTGTARGHIVSSTLNYQYSPKKVFVSISTDFVKNLPTPKLPFVSSPTT
jgi:hypothetical protein